MKNKPTKSTNSDSIEKDESFQGINQFHAFYWFCLMWEARYFLDDFKSEVDWGELGHINHRIHTTMAGLDWALDYVQKNYLENVGNDPLLKLPVPRMFLNL